MNIVLITGNLTKDPEVKTVRVNGKEVPTLQFTLADNQKITKADGSEIEKTNWIRCEAWDSGAVAIGERFAKGDTMQVTGSLRTDEWVDKDSGDKRSDTKVRVQHFEKIQRYKKSQAQVPVTSGSQSSRDSNDSGSVPF